MGYANVSKYPGGKADWHGAGLPLKTGSGPAPKFSAPVPPSPAVIR